MKLLLDAASVVLNGLGQRLQLLKLLQLLQLLQEWLKAWVAQQAFVPTPIRAD